MIKKHIKFITLIGLLGVLAMVNCKDEKDDKGLLLGAAALASQTAGGGGGLPGTGEITETTVATPTFSPVAGIYTATQAVTLSTTTSGAEIRYTTNGSEPSCTTGTVYSTAVNVTEITTIKAVACKSGASGVGSATYTIMIGGAIQKLLNLTGAVSVYAGPANGSTTSGTTDGTITTALFTGPMGMTTDGSNLYVTEYGGHKIRKIVVATGTVTTLAGSTVGFADGTGSDAKFQNPHGITTDGTNLFVAERGNNRIRKVEISTGVVTTLAGSGTLGFADGTGTNAQFNRPNGITIVGTNLYVVDNLNHKIRKVVIATGEVTTLAGDAPGSADGIGTAATFNAPVGITSDGTNLYVADRLNNKIRKIVISTGLVSTVKDGLLSPAGITTDGTNLYVAEQAAGGHRIQKIAISTAAISVLAGSTTTGDQDGTGTSALFNNPSGLLSDGFFLYVTDTNNNKIRKIQ